MQKSTRHLEHWIVGYALLWLMAIPLGRTAPALGQEESRLEEPASRLAFPGAEGFGAYSRGGRGGEVMVVTNLNDAGEGSLRAAVDAEGPRTVVFDVAGTIELESELDIENPYITIAGQSAPGEGITLRDHSLEISTSHVIVRYIRSRLGDRSDSEGDAINISEGYHIIVDHCSTSWSLDEVLSAATDDPTLSHVTVQWCIISEALNPEGHGYGSLIRGCCGAKMSFHHNLYAHNHNRNPRPGNYDSNPYSEDRAGLTLDFRNNVIYNWHGGYAGYNADEESITRLNYVGNFLIRGPNSGEDSVAYQVGSPYNRAYFAGNWIDYRKPSSPWTLVRFGDWSRRTIDRYKRSRQFPHGPMETDAPWVSYERVLASAGASRPGRDAVDTRVVRSVRRRTGRIIDSQSEVGGWPDLASAPSPPDADSDGMPDYWENAQGLNPNDASDATQDRDDDGYTNLEEYLNRLTDKPR